MPKEKKRLSKKAKAALRTLTESRELAEAKAGNTVGEVFKSKVVTPRTSGAIKPRPDKKRG
ncbi:MAG TPA: hypothetical protein VL572_01520 [Pyrinomonadaceae bacterium]|jgi:hypothetical protein|nr:hypothetical protein [Pyrinomonadaceae bacterium]HVQ55574.1 hypothetical protein [Pyrinomonadaceae bacterium]